MSAPEVTGLDVLRSIDWLGNGGGIEFDTADWHDGEHVTVEGYAYGPDGKHYISARFKLIEFGVDPFPVDDTYEEEEEW